MESKLVSFNKLISSPLATLRSGLNRDIAGRYFPAQELRNGKRVTYNPSQPKSKRVILFQNEIDPGESLSPDQLINYVIAQTSNRAIAELVKDELEDQEIKEVEKYLEENKEHQEIEPDSVSLTSYASTPSLTQASTLAQPASVHWEKTLPEWPTQIQPPLPNVLPPPPTFDIPPLLLRLLDSTLPSGETSLPPPPPSPSSTAISEDLDRVNNYSHASSAANCKLSIEGPVFAEQFIHHNPNVNWDRPNYQRPTKSGVPNIFGSFSDFALAYTLDEAAYARQIMQVEDNVVFLEKQLKWFKAQIAGEHDKWRHLDRYLEDAASPEVSGVYDAHNIRLFFINHNITLLEYVLGANKEVLTRDGVARRCERENCFTLDNLIQYTAHDYSVVARGQFFLPLLVDVNASTFY